MPNYGWDLIKYKLAEKIVRGNSDEQYLMIFGGTSVTAGHDNYYNQSYPFVFERRIKKAFEALGIKLLVHNIAQGANNCRPSDHCYNAMGGDNADFMSWEQSFNCGRSKDVMEFMARYAYWNGAVIYYVASGGFIPDCAASKDPIPWISEDWSPTKAGITHKYHISADNATSYRQMQEDWYNDGNSVSRFTNQVYGGLYKAVGPHGYSVWGHSSTLCNNGKGCNALDVKGDCYERGGPHWMTKEAAYYAMDPNARGKNWHPTAGMHLMRGEQLAYNYAHILADTIYTIQQDLTNATLASNRSALVDYYHQKWEALRIPIPENALHSRSEETKLLPTCFTDFKPHFNPANLLSSIVLGQPEGWNYKEVNEFQGSAYGYGDTRPFYEAVGKDKEIHFRISNFMQSDFCQQFAAAKTREQRVILLTDKLYGSKLSLQNPDRLERVKYTMEEAPIELIIDLQSRPSDEEREYLPALALSSSDTPNDDFDDNSLLLSSSSTDYDGVSTLKKRSYSSTTTITAMRNTSTRHAHSTSARDNAFGNSPHRDHRQKSMSLAMACLSAKIEEDLEKADLVSMRMSTWQSITATMQSPKSSKLFTSILSPKSVTCSVGAAR
eukprot:gene7876-5657_t